MGKRRKWSPPEDDSSSSSTDDTSIEETTPRRRRSRARRNTSKEGKVFIKVLAEFKEQMHKQSKQFTETMYRTSEMLKQLEKLKDDTSEMRKQLEKLTERHNDLRTQFELHTNGTSTDDSAAPSSQSNQVEPPRFRLVFTSGVLEKIGKGQNIEIDVALVDGNNDHVKDEPLASATVELVVVSAEFNQHDNQYNWSREDFESNIKRARQGNSSTGDADRSVKSIVNNGRFKLFHGAKCHSGSRIFSNSGNKKVRLGVMVVSPTDERVLEGLSNPFFVRGHDRPARQSNLRHNRSNKQSQVLVDDGYQEQNGPMPNLQNPSWPNSTQAGGITLKKIIGGQPQLPFLASTTFLSTEPSINYEQQTLIQQYQVPRQSALVQATNNQTAADELSSALVGYVENPFFMSNDHDPVHAIGNQFNTNQIALPVRLVWDTPNVEHNNRCWNLLDQFMPMYSCWPNSDNFGLPTMRLMPGNLGSLTIVPKEVMQSRRKRGVCIEPLPNDLYQERPLKRKLYSKYRLRFVNKVCASYYTMDPIKADGGDLLKVALFDENNTKITFGPLSSASVEVVVLQGDFNVDDQDYWTSEEFSRCVVRPRPGEVLSVLGGDRVLVLADGEACLSNAFFQIPSVGCRTGKFKMGVIMLASVQEEIIQEGITEPFCVMDNNRVKAGSLGDGPTHRRGSKRQIAAAQHMEAMAGLGVLLETTTTKATMQQQKEKQKLLCAAAARAGRMMPPVRVTTGKNDINCPSSSASFSCSSFFCVPVALLATARCSLPQQCLFCSTELAADWDLYMYRGDRAFCSHSCRCKHIRRVEEMIAPWSQPWTAPIHPPQQRAN